jgi:hypothetical protein
MQVLLSVPRELITTRPRLQPSSWESARVLQRQRSVLRAPAHNRALHRCHRTIMLLSSLTVLLESARFTAEILPNPQLSYF